MSVSLGISVFHATMGTRIPDVTRRSPTQAHAHLQDLFLFVDAQKESEGVMRVEVRGCEHIYINIDVCVCWPFGIRNRWQRRACRHFSRTNCKLQSFRVAA